jgi:hypothetical protein
MLKKLKKWIFNLITLILELFSPVNDVMIEVLEKIHSIVQEIEKWRDFIVNKLSFWLNIIYRYILNEQNLLKVVPHFGLYWILFILRAFVKQSCDIIHYLFKFALYYWIFFSLAMLIFCHLYPISFVSDILYAIDPFFTRFRR